MPVPRRGGGDGGVACSLTVSPSTLNFGGLTVGVAVQKSVTVTNVGGSQCSITGTAFSTTTDPAFSLVNPSLTSFMLSPGYNQAIAVSCDVSSFTPPLLRQGALVFQSNDPGQPSESVALSAYLQAGGPGGGWPKWHNDDTNEGFSVADTSGDVGNLVWKFSVGIPQVAAGAAGQKNPNPTYMNSPVVDGSGNVYQVGMSGTFYAISPTGTQLWTANLLPPNPDEHPATPVIAADGTIYVETGTDNPSFTAQMYHLSATGSILSQSGPPTGSTCYSGTCNSADGFSACPSIGNDGLLFAGDHFGQTVTYTLNSGGALTQANEVILEFYGQRVTFALDQSDNSYWCSLNVCFGVSSPAAGFTQMAAWPAAGAAIGNASGNSAVAWTNPDLAYDESYTGWLMVEAGTQTGSTGQTEVVAMDPSNGSLHWDVTLPSGPTPGSYSPDAGVGIFSSDVGNSAPAIDATDGTVYVGNVDGLYALVGSTGAIKTGFPYKPSQDSGANADVDSAPAIGADRTVFFGTAGGTFYAVNPDGTERYHFKTGGRISSSPAIGPDGTVFFVSDDGSLYAVR